MVIIVEMQKNNGQITSYQVQLHTNDIVGLAVDLDNGTNYIF